MHRMRRGTSDGFTLVELLIVVVILGILAGVVVFAMGDATTTSRTQGCKTEAHEFTNAFAGYLAVHNGREVGGSTVADKAQVLHDENLLSAATLTYLSPTQGGMVASASSARWTFDVSHRVADASTC